MEYRSLHSDLQNCCSEESAEKLGDSVQKVRGKFSFPSTFAGFQGHFPSQPVLPAIVQLGAIRVLCEKALGVSLQPKGLERVKFKGMVLPDEELFLTVSLSQEGPELRGQFVFKKTDQSLISSGSAIFIQHIE